MKGFIEVTNHRESMKQLVNINQIESITELRDGSIVHFNKSGQVTVRESYDYIKELIKKTI